VFVILSSPRALFGGSLLRIPRISSSVTIGLTGNGSGYLALRRSDRSAGFGSGKKCPASRSAFPLYVVTASPWQLVIAGNCGRVVGWSALSLAHFASFHIFCSLPVLSVTCLLQARLVSLLICLPLALDKARYA